MSALLLQYADLEREFRHRCERLAQVWKMPPEELAAEESAEREAAQRDFEGFEEFRRLWLSSTEDKAARQILQGTSNPVKVMEYQRPAVWRSAYVKRALTDIFMLQTELVQLKAEIEYNGDDEREATSDSP